MRNHIQIAASSEHLYHARILLLPSLGIQDSETFDRLMPDEQEWKRLTHKQRLLHIASWMQGQVFELLEDKDEETAEEAA